MNETVECTGEEHGLYKETVLTSKINFNMYSFFFVLFFVLFLFLFLFFLTGSKFFNSPGLCPSYNEMGMLIMFTPLGDCED